MRYAWVGLKPESAGVWRENEGCLFKSCFPSVLAPIVFHPGNSDKLHITPLARSQAVNDLLPVPGTNILRVPTCTQQPCANVLVDPDGFRRVTPCCWFFFFLPLSHSLWRYLAGLNGEFLSPWLSKWLPLLFPLRLEDLGDPRGEGGCHTSMRCTRRFSCVWFCLC